MINMEPYNCKDVLFIDPFHGGSHKQLMDILTKYVENPTTIYLRPKKWHWKARCSGLMVAYVIPEVTKQKVLFCTSVLNLVELLGLRPDLQSLKKVVYFHENQLVYPVQVMKQRDIQYQINQVTTCLVADIIIFNSCFNKKTFLLNINKIIKLIPDFKLANAVEQIDPKCMVLYFPITYPVVKPKDRPSTLHIIWPHRWEYDKNPSGFFNVLYKLKAAMKNFVVSILGEQYSEIPDVFPKAKEILEEEIINYGYMQNKEEYLDTLATGHVVVSTANHEFFGVAMLEATYLKCYPLVPKRLVYPEIYPPECLYATEEELFLKLCMYCDYPQEAINARQTLNIDLKQFSEDTLVPKFLNVLQSK